MPYSVCMSTNPKRSNTQPPTPDMQRGSLYWPAPLMESVEALAAEQGRSFNQYLALLAARQVAIVERRRQRKSAPAPEAA